MTFPLTRTMRRWQYSDTITDFLAKSPDAIMGELVNASGYSIETTQRRAWHTQIEHLQASLQSIDSSGKVYFEFDVPRMGKRIDAVVLVGPVIFVLEYKVGEADYPQHAILQVWDYALDLKHFHETSHGALMVPVLVASEAPLVEWTLETDVKADGLYRPVCTNTNGLARVIQQTLWFHQDGLSIDPVSWENGRYAHVTPAESHRSNTMQKAPQPLHLIKSRIRSPANGRRTCRRFQSTRRKLEGSSGACFPSSTSFQHIGLGCYQLRSQRPKVLEPTRTGWD